MTPDAGPEPPNDGAQATADLPDLGRINGYGRRAIAGFEDLVSVTPLGKGFSNPTFLVRLQTGDALVLRAMPAVRSSPMAHRIDREFRVMRELHGGPVPVPRPIHFCADPEPIGVPFYLMAFVDGTVFADGALPPVPVRQQVMLRLAECLGRLHGLDHRRLGLADFGTRSPRPQWQRQLHSMVRLYRETAMDHQPAMEQLIGRLKGVAPFAHETCLVHGDFRLGNIVIDPECWQIAAVLDWELSTLGDPLSDVGYCTLMYRWSSPMFGTLRKPGAGLALSRSADEAEFLDSYCRAAGRDALPDLSVHQAFSLLRLACMAQAALFRVTKGHALQRPLPPENHPAAVARQALALLDGADRHAQRG